MFDGGGLYVEISPTGVKLWRWKYRYGGKEKRSVLGSTRGQLGRGASAASGST
ncbi:Arm DNA-binding domain-containing protein [Xanthomonas cannabis]|uniref:Arm DNA-binding domain-containing protein n=1 Tax=Xanthomonas cannabis TaxID=1885674 RepID=UPI0030B89780